MLGKSSETPRARTNLGVMHDTPFRLHGLGRHLLFLNSTPIRNQLTSLRAYNRFMERHCVCAGHACIIVKLFISSEGFFACVRVRVYICACSPDNQEAKVVNMR